MAAFVRIKPQCPMKFRKEQVFEADRRIVLGARSKLTAGFFVRFVVVVTKFQLRPIIRQQRSSRRTGESCWVRA